MFFYRTLFCGYFSAFLLHEILQASRQSSMQSIQSSLLHGHLLGWFERFEQACRAADTFGFYGASARLLGVFLKMDANYLSLVKPAPSAD